MSSVPDATRDVGSVEVFCSYSHRDQQYREQFDAHAAVMKRQKLIQIWQDRKIVAGEDWAGEIDEHLNSADIVALLVSSDFLNSDYCYEKEMKRAMQRHAKQQARVVPIIVRPCDWHDAPFGKLQAIPPDGRPVTSWANRDEAWTEVAKFLKLTVLVILASLLRGATIDLGSAEPQPLPAKRETTMPKQSTSAESTLLEKIVEEFRLVNLESKHSVQFLFRPFECVTLGTENRTELLEKIHLIVQDVFGGADRRQAA